MDPGAGLTATSSTALLALPALLAVRRVLAMRGAAPLPRGALERDLVMGAGVIGALGALAWADGCALALGSYGAAEMAILLATCVAPVPLAAVSWVAGEMLSRLVPPALRELHSRRRGRDGDQLALLCGALGRPAAAAAGPRPGRHPADGDVLVVAARRENLPRRAR